MTTTVHAVQSNNGLRHTYGGLAFYRRVCLSPRPIPRNPSVPAPRGGTLGL
jgi:hypothetical protein